MSANSSDETVHFRTAPERLQPWVEELWYSRGRLDNARERVLPSATADIVANLGPAMRLVHGSGPSRIVGTTVSGLLTKPIVLEHPEIHEAVGIRLTPHGIRGILGIPAAAVRDAVVDLPELVASAVDELAQTCHRASTPTERLNAATAWVMSRVALHSDTADPIVRWATDQIDARGGVITVSRLQRESGYGATRFTARFKDELGITPKKYARLVRYRRALDSLSVDIDLAQLALSLGYSDQAHMNHDFRSFGDKTPTEVLAARYPSGITLAEQ